MNRLFLLLKKEEQFFKMATEEEETRGNISDTIAQIASNYKIAQDAGERKKADKEAKEFIETVAKGEDEVEEYTKMYEEMKS